MMVITYSSHNSYKDIDLKKLPNNDCVTWESSQRN